jgi:hypothetical protein
MKGLGGYDQESGEVIQESIYQEQKKEESQLISCWTILGCYVLLMGFL